MNTHDLQAIEMDLFLEALKRRHGYDFCGYARASLKRRVLGLLAQSGATHLSELIPPLLHDPAFLGQVVAALSVPVSEMFRDPPVFRALVTEVFPHLASYPAINIWQAGCAAGEEVYSLAILLKEAGLYDNCQIFATDINDVALTQAEEGLYPIRHIRQYSENYLEAGGKASLSDYYYTRYNFAKMNDNLRKNVVFAHHNLVSDGVFCEFHLILCRNVLIYFNRELQDRVVHLFHDSLVRGGFLCLGNRESLQFSDLAGLFRVIDRQARIFQGPIRLRQWAE